MAECRSCGARILWAKTARGKAMPLDTEPVIDSPHGLMTVTDHDGDLEVHAVRGNLYRSHFATCPNAKEHRR